MNWYMKQKEPFKVKANIIIVKEGNIVPDETKNINLIFTLRYYRCYEIIF